eukprot:jgi/Tetstr1/441195/TSEL_029451.t1
MMRRPNKKRIKPPPVLNGSEYRGFKRREVAKLKAYLDSRYEAFLNIATAKEVTPYMHEVAWNLPRWMELHGNLDALSAQCMEHCNMDIKEGFRKGSNH